MLAIGVAILVLFSFICLFFVVKGIRQGLDVTDRYNTTGKKYIGFGVFALVFAIVLSSVCFVKDAEFKRANNFYTTEGVDVTTTEAATEEAAVNGVVDDSELFSEAANADADEADSDSFTNKYGTRTTKCVVSGCDNYIAKSGDTNCCTVHSNKCGECYCYIDGDAMYCMDCLSDAVNNNSNSGSSGSGVFTNKYGTRTTICVASGCDKYIAKSGDTNCCEIHSNKCGECHCYIDGDAMYCMSCLSGALGGDSDYNSGSSYGADYSYSSGYSSGHECYVCGDKAYSKYGSYYYCSDCLALVKAFSE